MEVKFEIDLIGRGMQSWVVCLNNKVTSHRQTIPDSARKIVVPDGRTVNPNEFAKLCHMRICGNTCTCAITQARCPHS